MNITLTPGPLHGQVEIPSSKSFAHRLLIAAALSDAPTEVHANLLSDDIRVTASCLSALGAKAEETAFGYRVTPIEKVPEEPRSLFCGESGSTLRFFIPLCAALGVDCTLSGAGRLPQRPNALLTEALRSHGVLADSDFLPMHLKGRLSGGTYSIAGNVSSQYITGLLLALPLCGEDSEILLTTRLESAAYVDITLEVLRLFGIVVEKRPQGYFIPGHQHYRSPGKARAEGDWSSAAFWKTANVLGSQVDCLGLLGDSIQGDRAICEMLHRLGSEIDVSDTPDLVPTLAVAAAAHPGTTRIVGAARLRMKESDRLSTVFAMLRALGVSCTELSDALVIEGGNPFRGGVVDGCNDHRIVMSAAIAATAAQGPVTIKGYEAVNKSYPSFFEDWVKLGGVAYVEPDR